MGRRLWYLATSIAAVLAIVIASVLAPSLRVQASSCNMSGYKAMDGLAAGTDGDGLALAWVGEQGADLRMRLGVDSGTPIVRELAIRRKGGQWATVGRNLVPEFATRGRT